MGVLYSLLFGRKQAETPITNPLPRIKNILTQNFRGVIGTIVPIILFGVIYDYEKKYNTVIGIWFAMFWFILLQPVAVPAAGFIPLFALPIFGIMSTKSVCAVLFNENIVLLFLGGWLLLLLNNTGMDKRLACFFLCQGGNSSFSARRLTIKTMTAAFLLSMICNRILVVIIILEYIIPPLNTVAKVGKKETNYGALKAIICNGVATSAAIGSICIMHASLTTLQFRALYCELGSVLGLEYPDTFNYLQYTAFAFPTATVMFILNLVYHILLVKFVTGKPMTNVHMLAVKNTLSNEQKKLGKMTSHQTLSVLFLVASLACFFTRWSKWLDMGWATFRREESSPELPGVKDATTAAIFVIALHLIPKDINFVKIFSAKKEKDYPPAKVASGILFWKFIDKNTDYSYFILMGGGFALYLSIFASGLNDQLQYELQPMVEDMSLNVALLIIILLAAFFANIMSGCGAQAVFMPIVVTVGTILKPLEMYLFILATGLATGLGFTVPFLHTTCHFTKTIGEIPLLVQIKYAVLSVIICALVLWVFVSNVAYLLWDPDREGVIPVVAPTGGFVPTTTTTAEPPPAP